MIRSPLFILDTNVVSEFSKPRPDPRVLAWIEAAPPGSLAISSSTVFELQVGIELARRAGSPRTEVYERALGDLLGDPRFKVVRPTTRDARMRARMHATPGLRAFSTEQRSGMRSPRGEDLAIAATAMSAGAAIATRNIRDFVAIGRLFELPGVFDPASGVWAIQAPSLHDPDGRTEGAVSGLSFGTTARLPRASGARRQFGSRGGNPDFGLRAPWRWPDDVPRFSSA